MNKITESEDEMNREREISIADIFFKILYAWKGVIVSAIVFTIIFGGYAFYKYKRAQSDYEVALANYEKNGPAVSQDDDDIMITRERAEFEGFSLDDATRINTALSYRREIENNEAYLNDSLLMRLNPNKIRACSFVYHVKAGSEEESRVTSAYLGFVREGGLSAAIGSVFGETETRFVSELITGDFVSAVDDTDPNLKTVVCNIGESDSFVVRVFIPDGVDEAGLANSVEKAFADEKQELAGSIGSHDLVLISKQTGDIVDTSLRDKKFVLLNQNNQIRNNIKTLTDGMSEKMLAIVYGNDKGSEDMGPTKPAFSKKYVLLGFLLGGFLAVVLVALKVIFSGKLGNLAELKDYFGFRSLGNLSDKKKRRGLTGLFASLRHKNEKKMDDETRTDIICSNIELLCEKEEIKKLVLTGTETEKLDAGFKEKLIERLKSKGIEAECTGNICYDMQALRKTSEVGYAVVAEIEGLSKYREIEDEITALKDNGINILGCIGVGDVSV